MSYFEWTNYQAENQDSNLPICSPIHINKIMSIDKTDFGKIMFTVSINGIEFTRLSNIDMKSEVLWTDVNSHFGQRDLMSKEKESELESIFKAMISLTTPNKGE